MSRLTPTAVVLQLPTPCVVAMLGAYGAGKSTYARRLARLGNVLAISQHAAVLASLPRLHTEGWHSVHILHANHLAQPAEGTA